MTSLAPSDACSDDVTKGEVVQEQPKFGDALKVFQQLTSPGFHKVTRSELKGERNRVPVRKLILPINIDQQQNQPVQRRTSDIDNDPVLLELRSKHRVSGRYKRSNTPDSDDSSSKDSYSAKEDVKSTNNNEKEMCRTESTPNKTRLEEKIVEDEIEPAPTEKDDRKTTTIVASNQCHHVDPISDTPASNQCHPPASPSPSPMAANEEEDDSPAPISPPPVDVKEKRSPPPVAKRPAHLNGSSPVKAKTPPKVLSKPVIIPKSILKVNSQEPREVVLDSANFCQVGLQHAESEMLATDEDEDESMNSSACSPMIASNDLVSQELDENDFHDQNESSTGEESDDYDEKNEKIYFEICGLPAEIYETSPNFHRPTRVKFSVKPIKVFPAHAPEDYDRTNSTVQPHISAVEYELERRLEGMELIDITLNKGTSGLGIKVLGVGQEAGVQRLGIFIKEIVDGGAAHQDGRMRVFDQIVEVNGVSLVGVEKEFASSVLRSTDGLVQFKIGRDVNVSNSDIAKLVQSSREESNRPTPEEEFPSTMGEQAVGVVVNQLSQVGSSSFTLNGFINGVVGDNLPVGDLPYMDEGEDAEEAARSVETQLSAAELKLSAALQHCTAENNRFLDLSEAVGQVRSRYQQLERLVMSARRAEEEEREAREKAEFDLKEMSLDKSQLEEKCSSLEASLAKEKKESAEREAKFSLQETELSGYRDLMEDTQGQNIKLEEMTKKYKKVKRLMKEAQASEKTFKTEKETLAHELEKKETYIVYIKETVTRLQTELQSLQNSANSKVDKSKKNVNDPRYSRNNSLTPEGDKRMDQIFDSHPDDSTICRKPIKSIADEVDEMGDRCKEIEEDQEEEEDCDFSDDISAPSSVLVT